MNYILTKFQKELFKYFENHYFKSLFNFIIINLIIFYRFLPFFIIHHLFFVVVLFIIILIIFLIVITLILFFFKFLLLHDQIYLRKNFHQQYLIKHNAQKH